MSPKQELKACGSIIGARCFKYDKKKKPLQVAAFILFQVIFLQKIVSWMILAWEINKYVILNKMQVSCNESEKWLL